MNKCWNVFKIMTKLVILTQICHCRLRHSFSSYYDLWPLRMHKHILVKLDVSCKVLSANTRIRTSWNYFVLAIISQNVKIQAVWIQIEKAVVMRRTACETGVDAWRDYIKVESIGPHIATPGKYQNSKFEVRFLLNA